MAETRAPPWLPLAATVSGPASSASGARRGTGCSRAEQPTDKPLSPEDLARGPQADGLSTALGGLCNAFSFAAFAQNADLVRFSNVRSRYVVAGLSLLLRGFLPKMAALVAAIPLPVLGGVIPAASLSAILLNVVFNILGQKSAPSAYAHNARPSRRKRGSP